MIWSKYQQDVFDAVENTEDSLLIEAVAGSGKTTTIVEAIKHVSSRKSVAFLAFNKSIAQELGRRITNPNAKCMTLHSCGFTAWKRFVGTDVQVDSRKTFEIIKNSLTWPERNRNSQLSKLIGLAKQIGMVPGDEQRLSGSFVDEIATDGLLPGCHEGAICKGLVEDDLAVWRDLMELYGIDEDEAEISIVRRILRDSIAQARVVMDFDDMLYMPVISEASFEKFDVVFVDEAQDLSGIQRVMISRMLKPSSRVIAVGDRHQAIYAFRGASSDAMPLLASEFGCKPLPLSISYRCPKAVVKKAQSWVEHIEFAETAPEGLVVEYPEQWLLRDFLPSDSILCRLTRPLVEVAFILIRARIPCRVLGRDIGAGLLALVKKSKITPGSPLSDFEGWLDFYHQREVRKLTEREEPAKLGLLNDKVETLRVFIDDLSPASTVFDLQKSIEALFSDNDAGKLTLSTVHKSKGLEYPRVFILDAHELMPCPWANRPGDLQQEKNLMYVACTRAQNELYYITSEQLSRSGSVAHDISTPVSHFSS